MKPGETTLSASVRAEAAAWVAQLHSSSRSRALEAGLRRWLQANPAHRKAFEIATEAWEIGGSIPSGALPRIAHSRVFERTPGQRIFTRPRLAFAALCAMVIGGLLYVGHDQPAVSTEVGEQRMLTLEDGSRIFLNTDTRLVVHESPTRREIRFQSGEAMFDVVKDSRRSFVVVAGDREVVALGTAFVVRRDPRQLSVTLVEGKVAVSDVSSAEISKASGLEKKTMQEGMDPAMRSDADPLAASVLLVPGQRLTFRDAQPPKLDEPPIEKVTAWRRGEVILEKTRLQDAADELNRYSVIKLEIEKSAADIRVSGIFRAGDSLRFAQAVAETYHLDMTHQDHRVTISGSLGDNGSKTF